MKGGDSERARPESAPAGIQIWALVFGLPGHRRGKRGMFMLQALVDESEGDDIFVMAGYLSTAEEWALLFDAWDIENKSPRRIEYFKYSEWRAPGGQFHCFSDDERDVKIANLHKLICKHAMLGISVALKVSEFNKFWSQRRLPKHHRKLPVRFRSKYALAAFTLMSTLSKEAPRLGMEESIDFIFDNQVMESWKIQELHKTFRDVMNIFGRTIGDTPIFKDEVKFPPLQAADMLAGRMLAAQKNSFGIIAPYFVPRRPLVIEPQTISQVKTEDEIRELRERFDRALLD
jgi:Protein of unknown function (DUF3800)